MQSRKQLLDMQFMGARSRVIELAAFLDRMDRHPGEDDPRLTALRDVLPILLSERSDRAKAVLEALSDRSGEVPISAASQGAIGVPPHAVLAS